MLDCDVVVIVVLPQIPVAERGVETGLYHGGQEELRAATGDAQSRHGFTTTTTTTASTKFWTDSGKQIKNASVKKVTFVLAFKVGSD